MNHQFEKELQSFHGQMITPAAGFESIQSSDIHQEGYLRKTIQIKNKNIDELLRELKQTKQLYLEYKNQYMSEERKMKLKVSDLSARLDVQVSELQKLKMMNNKMRGELQTARNKQQRLVQAHAKEMKERAATMSSLQLGYNDLKAQNNHLKQNNQFLIAKCSHAQEKSKKLQIQLSDCKSQISKLQQQLVAQVKKWQHQKGEFTRREGEKEQKKSEKARMNDKLSHIQNRIKDTLRKI